MEIEFGSRTALWMPVAGAMLLLVVTRWFLWVTDIRYGSKLAKGSYGWPFIGETVTFLRMRGHPRQFVDQRVQKYGKSFKTHLFGFPTFMNSDPAVAAKIYSLPTSMLRGNLPESAMRLIGPHSYQFGPGKEHDSIHKIIQNFFFPQSFVPYLPEIEKKFEKAMRTWNGRGVSIKKEMKEVVAAIIMEMFAGYSDGDEYLIRTAAELLSGGDFFAAFFSVPINFPGTTYNRGLKQREKMIEIAKILIEKRKHGSEVKSGVTLLDALLEYKDEQGEPMSSVKIVDSLMSVLFGGFDSTPSTFACTMKNLIEHPEALALVQAEQDAIRKARLPGEPLTPDDLKKMKYTEQAILESLRNPGGGPFSTRRALEDLQIGDYIVPKGWNVINFFPAYHYDNSSFPNPETFDMAHFSEKITPRQFSPFGGGPSICPGRELAKMELKIMVHIFVTKFRWEYDGVPNPKLDYFPVCAPVDGLRLKIYAIEPETKA